MELTNRIVNPRPRIASGLKWMMVNDHNTGSPATMDANTTGSMMLRGAASTGNAYADIFIYDLPQDEYVLRFECFSSSASKFHDDRLVTVWDVNGSMVAKQVFEGAGRAYVLAVDTRGHGDGVGVRAQAPAQQANILFQRFVFCTRREWEWASEHGYEYWHGETYGKTTSTQTIMLEGE